MALFLPSTFLLCHQYLDFLSKFPFQFAVATFKFFSYFLNHGCFENVLPTFIPFVVFICLPLLFIYFLSFLSALTSKFSFYISILVCCPYFAIFSFMSLKLLAFKHFFLCLLLFPLLFFSNSFLSFLSVLGV